MSEVVLASASKELVMLVAVAVVLVREDDFDGAFANGEKHLAVQQAPVSPESEEMSPDRPQQAER